MNIAQVINLLHFHIGHTEFNKYFHMVKNEIDKSEQTEIPFNPYFHVDSWNMSLDTILMWVEIVNAVKNDGYHFDFILTEYKSDPTIEDCQKVMTKHNFNHKNFISYIKAVRMLTGMGLADAKNYCETKLGVSMRYVP